MAFTDVPLRFAAASQDIRPVFERGSLSDARGRLDVLVRLGGRASFLNTGFTPSPRRCGSSFSLMTHSGPSDAA
ncbi:MAG: hypothetical protein ABIO86_21435 [Sphingomonas sp.]